MNEKDTSKKALIKKISIISVSALLGIGFAGNICYAIFSGGEFKETEKQEEKIPGMLRLSKAVYINSYFENDTFSFDKEKSIVTLVCKDPSIENLAKVDDLPALEYGFKKSHYEDEEGNTVSKKEAMSEEKDKYKEVFSDFYMNAEDITLDKDTADVYLVSKRYQNLMTKLDTDVIKGHIDQNKLTDNLVLEAEDAEIYKEDVLLSKEELATNPDAKKPFLSNNGEEPLSDEVADKLSGKACLRNFQSYNMKVDYTILTSQECEASLSITYCTRKESKKFDSYYKVLVNNDSYEEINSQSTIKGTDFFTPQTLSSVSVKLHKGINHITFESGSNLNRLNPVNLDCISLKCQSALLADIDAVVLED